MASTPQANEPGSLLRMTGAGDVAADVEVRGTSSPEVREVFSVMVSKPFVFSLMRRSEKTVKAACILGCPRSIRLVLTQLVVVDNQ
ncbi:hypothetical protein RB201_36160 [Streptomyces sp. S1A(2023)]